MLLTSSVNKIKKGILPAIVFSQFCCTSLWFASNAVMRDIVDNFHLNEHALEHLTSAVQFGFITGTLLFALLTIADRFPPSRVFFVSAIIGAVFNLGVIAENNQLASLLTLRFLTGFFLAGIYPVGMKIAADYYEQGLGRSLGFLVGALVLGTAFPHLLNSITYVLPWKVVLVITSSLAISGGFLILLFVPDGPFRKAGRRPDLSVIFKVFRNRQLRSAAFGYFGHMWELYAFWTFLPLMLAAFFPGTALQGKISFWSFVIIGSAGLACVLGGYLSQRTGIKRAASMALFLSCMCCLFSPLFFFIGSAPLFIAFLIFWGMVVVADSPLFSTLVAMNARAETKGTTLTIVNCIGFSITIISIQLLGILKNTVDPAYLYLVLALGPVLGLIALKEKGSVKE